MTTVLSFVFLVFGAAIFFLIVAAFRKWQALPLYVVTVLSAIAWDLPGYRSLVSLGGTTITVEDLVVSAVVVTALSNPSLLLANTARYRLLLAVSALLIGFSLIAGFILFETGTVVNEFRSFYYPLGFSLWALNYDWFGEKGRLAAKQWMIATGLVLSVVAIYHVILYGVGEPDSFVVSSLTGFSNTGRPLVSDQAMLLTLVGLCLVAKSRDGGQKRDRWFGFFFLVVAIACQHRSVWIAVIVAVSIMVIRLSRISAARVLAGFFCAILATAIVALSGIASSAMASIFAAAENTGTLDGRVASWTQLVDGAFREGAWIVLFGEPFGFGYARIEAGNIISYAPHNWYVSVFLRLGLVGLALFIYLMITTFVRLLRFPNNNFSVAVYAAIGIYIAAYSLSWLIVAVFAALMAESLQDSTSSTKKTELVRGQTIHSSGSRRLD